MKKPADHDAYIEQAAPFAVPILERLRAAVHAACPGVEETIRWNAPHFDHGGILVGMAAFKRHVNFTFWRGSELDDPEGLFGGVGRAQMRVMRFEELADLPAQRVLVRYVKQAVRLNEAGGKAPRKKAGSIRGARAERRIEAPPDLLAALEQRKKARATFEGFGYSARKEYVEWITEAKREATREKRIATAVEWLAEGKPRNWKYMKEWR